MTGNTYMPLDLEHGRTLCHFEQRQYWGFRRISWIWVTARHFQIQWPVTQWIKETPSTSNHLYNASCSMKLNQSLFLENNGDKGVLFRKILRLIFRHLGFFRTYNAVWEENKILVPSLFAFYARVMSAQHKHGELWTTFHGLRKPLFGEKSRRSIGEWWRHLLLIQLD